MTRTSWKSVLVTIVKLAIIVTVVFFIGRAVQTARVDLARQPYSLRNLRPAWLVLASLSYLLGIFPMAAFWHRLLHALGENVRWFPTIRAHYVGQLGKYVPGKAMVLAIRLGMVRRQGIDMTAGVLSVFSDTLTMMSVGAVLALMLLASRYRDEPWVLAAGLLMAMGAAIPSSPPIMKVALEYFYRQRTGRQLDASRTARLTAAVLAPGWLGIAGGWFLMGVSMWATLKALDLEETRQLAIADIPEITAVVAASVVGGFASILPAGFGVREWIYNELITPRYGTIAGVLAPVLSRLVWLISELIISAILYGCMSASDRSWATEVEQRTDGPVAGDQAPPASAAERP